MSYYHLCRIGFYCTLIIVTVSAFSPAEIALDLTAWDKANHFFAFLVLAGLLDFAYPKTIMLINKLTLLLVYGLFIEVVQAYLPSREFSLLDLIADALGLLCYLGVQKCILAKLGFLIGRKFQN